jgi:PBP1b-binding outer membrane lipoprotein LpoB
MNKCLFKNQNSQVCRAGNLGLLLGTLLISACAGVDNTKATPTIEQNPAQRGAVSGVGIEAQDITSMTDKMMRDMLASPTLANQNPPPQIIIDSEYFENESSQRLNKNVITDRLRVELNRASRGRMVFVGRHYSDMVAHERELKREGVVDVGTTGLTQAQAGGDYRLGGRINSMDSRDSRTGLVQRYNQITFEMMDLERGVIVWSGIYEFSRAAGDDVIYR